MLWLVNIPMNPISRFPSRSVWFLGVQNDEVPLSTEESKTDTADVTGDMKLESNNPEVPLDFLPKPSPQHYNDDDILAPYIVLFWKINLRAVKKTTTVWFWRKINILFKTVYCISWLCLVKPNYNECIPLVNVFVCPKNSEVYCYGTITTSWDISQLNGYSLHCFRRYIGHKCTRILRNIVKLATFAFVQKEIISSRLNLLIL